MKSINKYFLAVLFLFGIIFSQDTDPPYFFCQQSSGQNCSNALDFPNEVNFDSGVGEFNFSTILEIFDGWEVGGSGVYSIGFELIGPSGDVEDLTIFGNEGSNQLQGSLSNYVTEVWVFTGDNAGGFVNLMLPISEFELGTHQFRFIATDYAGNQLIVEDGEIPVTLDSENGDCCGEIIYVDYNPYIGNSTESEIYIDEYGDVPILNWGWGLFQLVLIDSDALSGLEEGTDIYVLDELGIPDEGCDGDFGPIIVGYNTYQGEMETPYELVCGQGIDLCGFNGPRLPGYVEGNPMKIYADNNGSTLEGEVTQYSLGEGTFGEPLTYITGINFERSDVQLSNIHSIETNNSRNQYRYNVYRNEELYLSEYESVYYIDEDINDNTDYCYEVYLIDNYDNSEFLATDEVCFYSETDFLLGDINQDGLINVLDVVSIVGYILGSQEFNETEFYLSDYNQDSFINVLDVVLIVQAILGGW